MPNFTEPLPEQQRDMAVRLAWSLLWTPYAWGGDDFSSRDCSGMVVEILGAVGVIERDLDYSAAGLYELFKANTTYLQYRGNLVFWWQPSTEDTSWAVKITHVEMLIDAYWTIGASGGGRPMFDVYREIQKDPMLKNFYGHLSREDIEEREGDFILSLIRRELFRKQAIEQNAFIKPNLLSYRGDRFYIVDPFMDD